MRALALLLVLASAACAAEPVITVEVKLPLPVVEAIDAAVASAVLQGQTVTRESMIASILAGQAQRMTEAAMAQEAQRRAAAKVPALLAFKRRIAKVVDAAEKAKAKP